MISSTMVRRGKPPGGASNRLEAGTVLVENQNNGLDLMKPIVMKAHVKRNFCGTGPFDKHWFNVDCCGIFCALLTYGLHAYGVYCVCFVLIPPWMSYEYDEGDHDSSMEQTTARKIRFLSITGRFMTTLFTSAAFMAIAAHFKAMTTDPGAVPPDARPLPDPSEQDEDDEPSLTASSETDPKTGEPADLQLGLSATPSKTRRLCRRCKAFKPQRAHHCSVCGRCIIKMDHHCPWYVYSLAIWRATTPHRSHFVLTRILSFDRLFETRVNNCVGIGNHKYFLLFCFYTFVTCLLSLILVVIRFTTCMSGHSHYHHRGYQHQHLRQAEDAVAMNHSSEARATCLDQPSDLLLILGLLVEALLFGMFTTCMMFDQMEVVHTRMTHIDRLKGTQIGGNLEGIAEVFGVGFNQSKRGGGKGSKLFRADWLSPFHRICFPENVHDEVMGFCRPMLNNLGCGCGSIHETTNETELATPTAGAMRKLSDMV